ncbi:MAG: DUF2782 domain-containing protein [Gammaproteobacteria bacterium]|nr:DUF2782 domain-containing protein [Gammaproteobacteria bacterium]
MTLLALALCTLLPAPTVKAAGDDFRNDDIEIVEGKSRTIYEYRQSGRLIMIKVIPKKGKPYYMVPGDGSPHYTDLELREKLYPQWVIIEW